MTHWCRDIPRDEAVRAAEDNRQGPLPTLEECIEGVFFPIVAAGRATKRWLSNHSAWLSRQKPEQENKGNDMATKAEIQQAAYRAEAISRAGQSGPPEPSQQQNCTEREIGLPPERVTLEITREAWRRATPTSPDNWAYAAREAGITFLPGESVRVVEEVAPAVHRGSGVFDSNGDEVPWQGVVAALTAERDAAIRERESLREQLESVACRAATAEMALESAPAASGAAGSNKKEFLWCDWCGSSFECDESSGGKRRMVEPDNAFGPEQWENLCASCSAVESASGAANSPESPVSSTKGWLTAEERKRIKAAITVFGGMTAAKDPEKVLLEFWVDKAERDRVVSSLQSLLARSSPPEVVLPRECDGLRYDSFVAGWDGYRDEALKALAVAGVTVKEVGK